jgi:hypothetical protein
VTADLPAPMVPRLLALYHDEIDGQGRTVGWRPVAWAIALPGEAGAVTVSITRPVAVTLWHSLTAAEEGLDAYAGDVAPRRRVMELDG